MGKERGTGDLTEEEWGPDKGRARGYLTRLRSAVMTAGRDTSTVCRPVSVSLSTRTHCVSADTSTRLAFVACFVSGEELQGGEMRDST